jgi:hypothetical protein
MCSESAMEVTYYDNKGIHRSPERQPGTLAELSLALADSGVNIIAFQAFPTEGESTVRFVADNPTAAQAVLDSQKPTYTESQVAHTKLAHRPGALARAAKTLGEANLNINYAYTGIEPGTNPVSKMSRRRRRFWTRLPHKRPEHDVFWETPKQSCLGVLVLEADCYRVQRTSSRARFPLAEDQRHGAHETCSSRADAASTRTKGAALGRSWQRPLTPQHTAVI